MEEALLPPLVDGRITDIQFSIATEDEICTSSISGCPINHPSQLTNPFLGLPLETGKCESCGTAEPGQCAGHFGYIELPIPIYHPCHVSEVKMILRLVCLNCLRLKRGKNVGSDRSSSPCLFCPDIPQISINESKTTDGVVLLELEVARRSTSHNCWNFLDKFGYRYGNGRTRILLPCEVQEILKRFPEETKKKLSGKGYLPQDGYILQKLPVPPNCLSIPEISDGVSVMSSDLSVSMLRKVLKQVDIIKNSRSGRPNFESHKVEVNDLQSTVAQYLRARGTAKDSRDIKMRAGTSKLADDSATKAWHEKMRTFFISKGSGHSSRSVITGDAYKSVNEIGLPLEVAQKITFEEKVTECNKVYLQELVDKKMCITYKDGASMYSLREGSKGHTLLRVGQVVHRRIMDGDVVFINRPPSTHKHSLQALSIYVHEDHTVKINPLICGPLDADFDGDCVHIFYPQSLAARAEVLELFSVEQQLLSSHSGSLNLQLKNDALLSLKTMFKRFFLDKPTAQQLAMFISSNLPQAAILKANNVGPQWTVLEILQSILPHHFDCFGERYLISQSEILKVDFNRDLVQSMFNELISSVYFEMGSKEALNVFNSLQPLLMENLFLEGYSICLKDFSIPKLVLEDIPRNIQDISHLLHNLRSTYNELVELQVGSHLKSVKAPIVNFILKSSGLGNLIDSKSDSSVNKVVEQIGFLGLQLADRGKFYSKNLVEDMASLFLQKYAVNGVEYPSEAFGLIKSCFFHGLNPFEDLVHSISSREVQVRSSRGLTEPGTLFKNLMNILRDVIICYDGTVRNVCSNSIIQFEYGVEAGMNFHRFYPAGEPVGALAATAISNPAYKAVLDSSSSSNVSWELMKEVLLCRANLKNDLTDRQVILYLNDCGCVKEHCKENAAYLVQKQLKKVSLRDISVNFLIEYQNESPGTSTSLVGHIHIDKECLKELDRSMHEVLLKCQEAIGLFNKRKKSKPGISDFLKNICLSVSECGCSQQSYDSELCNVPCLQFLWRLDTSGVSLETVSQIMSNMICPIMLDTIIKGDRRVHAANIIWISPGTTSWVKNHCGTQHGEIALELVLEKKFVKKHGDAWKFALDSCLPVIHLIDTTRSIPYAIRQVQEILGISCAFDQAVQRLSMSIRMVNKGVLKEHLILAASSITCTGSLIGFNKGGYKALFRSLNVQIPFTEATMFTARKCFEKAAEKCHTDTLSGIVASCSWGKHVAVGSGTRFEILWNKKEMGLDLNGVEDIYNFLLLVSSSGRESNTACLGGDFDDLEIENRVAELRLSPDQNFDNSKPTFDDAELMDFEEPQSTEKGIFDESNWGKAASVCKSGGSSEWKVDQHGDAENADPWSNPTDSANWGSKTPAGEGPGNGWNTTESEKLPSSEPIDVWGKQVKESGTNGWGATADKFQTQLRLSERPSEKRPEAGWNTMESQELPTNEPDDAWGIQTNKSDGSAWGATGDKLQAELSLSERPCEEGRKADWNIIESQKLPFKEPIDAWGRQAKEPVTNGWDESLDTQCSQWNVCPESHSTKASGESPKSAGWNAMETEKHTTQTGHLDGPEQRAKAQWDKNGKNQDEQERELPTDAWGTIAEDAKNGSSWSQREQVNQPTDSLGWDSSSDTKWTTKEQTQDEEDRKLPWGLNMMQEQGKGPSGPRKWASSNSGDWKLKKNHPAQSPGRSKLDQFTSEEQKIYSEVEPIIASIKRIMHQSRYSDGDPLSSEDQSYILDNVLNYHPDKGAKIGPGLDYLTINKHKSFQGTRCFYVVSTDGRKEDFSYRKCLDNFIKEKYPEMAVSFIGKYWPQDRRLDNRTSWGNFTATRQKLDQFTSEEQKILSDVEPIILSLKKIMNPSSYNDGDRLSPDDQSYVLDNVLNHHPEKAVKIGPGVDYVTVDKHSNFQDSRCLYAVSTDGHREDFSYHKCVENFVKEKYPDLAATFIGKYWPPRNRGGHVQEQGPVSQF
ncbi:Dna-directed rna polymerase subunit [Thalictrum thalictroides]|uniref:DNA-directed RNA polymerase subunit n=1 Tax=Thalictrum thalictroides TaxID=46969 RepID=A0A7J6WG55_THATH|nr:Dna-directed rna polymerase subunit [Thalictrum thalictroides]